MVDALFWLGAEGEPRPCGAEITLQRAINLAVFRSGLSAAHVARIIGHMPGCQRSATGQPARPGRGGARGPHADAPTLPQGQDRPQTPPQAALASAAILPRLPHPDALRPGMGSLRAMADARMSRRKWCGHLKVTACDCDSLNARSFGNG